MLLTNDDVDNVTNVININNTADVDNAKTNDN
jgi:hypothetical protein